MTFEPVGIITLNAMSSEFKQTYQYRYHVNKREIVVVTICFVFLMLVNISCSQARGVFDKIRIVPDNTSTNKDAELSQQNPARDQAPLKDAPLVITSPKVRSPESSAPSADTSGSAQSKPQNPMTALRDKGLHDLDAQVEEEIAMMRSNVHLLNSKEAEAWLASFISLPPLSCPKQDQAVWIDVIINALLRNELPLCKECLGLVASIISIESGFNADPLAVDPSRKDGIAELVARVESEFYQKLGRLFYLPPIPGLYAEYRAKYYPMLLECRSEGDVDMLAKNIASELKRDADKLPNFARELINRHLDKLANIIRTKGSMQLNFSRAKLVMHQRGEEFTDKELTEYMYTRFGGVDVGVAALKPMFVQYAAYFSTAGDLSWLYYVGMDYHYGPFSSRNMMEQIRIRDLSGRDVNPDGDLLFYDDDGQPLNKNSQTLRAARAMFPLLSRDKILAAFVLEKDPHYVYTNIHRRIRMAHRSQFGETPFAVIGELWMGHEAEVKYGKAWNTHTYLNKLSKYLNSIPWDYVGCY